MSSDAIRSDALADAHLILNVRREGRARGCLEVEGAHLWGRGAGAVVSTCMPDDVWPPEEEGAPHRAARRRERGPHRLV